LGLAFRVFRSIWPFWALIWAPFGPSWGPRWAGVVVWPRALRAPKGAHLGSYRPYRALEALTLPGLAFGALGPGSGPFGRWPSRFGPWGPFGPQRGQGAPGRLGPRRGPSGPKRALLGLFSGPMFGAPDPTGLAFPVFWGPKGPYFGPFWGTFVWGPSGPQTRAIGPTTGLGPTGPSGPEKGPNGGGFGALFWASLAGPSGPRPYRVGLLVVPCPVFGLFWALKGPNLALLGPKPVASWGGALGSPGPLFWPVLVSSFGALLRPAPGHLWPCFGPFHWRAWGPPGPIWAPKGPFRALNGLHLCPFWAPMSSKCTLICMCVRGCVGLGLGSGSGLPVAGPWPCLGLGPRKGPFRS